MKNIYKNSQTYNSEIEIFKEDFISVDEAIEKMKSFDYGVIEKSKYGGGYFIVGEKNPRNQEADLYFDSENEDGFYYYTIENHVTFFRLIIKRTYKHKMITASMTGNLEMLIENFWNTDKMKEFSLNTAIINGKWNIVKYLVDNYDFKKTPLWDAIRYNKVEIVKNLIDSGYKLPKDWLAYCMYSDSLDVAKELILNRKAHLDFPIDELKTVWFQREIYKQSKTSEFVKRNVK